MVTVVMTTYDPGDSPRFEYAHACIDALNLKLIPPEPMLLVIADDGSPVGFDRRGKLWDNFDTVSIVTGYHRGIGASLNRALEGVYGPWMYTTDDWRLNQPLLLNLALWLIRDQDYDLVRLGPIHPNLKCTTRFTAGHGWWLDLTGLGDGDGGFYFATRPFVAAPSLIHKVGWFDEGLNAYATERRYSERCHDASRELKFAAINLLGPWQHIGDYEVGDREVGA